MWDRRCDEDDGAGARRAGSSRFRARAALAAWQTTSHAGSPARCNQRYEKEFLQVSNEENLTTEQPRTQALAMRAGGRKKATAKKAGRKAAPKKKAGRKAAPKKKAGGRKKAAAKKAGRKTAAKKKAASKKGGRRKVAARKKGGGRKKAAAAAAADVMPPGNAEPMN
jgi:hypothetical protein